MKFSEYDRRLVLPELHISEAPDPRTPEESAARIHDWTPRKPLTSADTIAMQMRRFYAERPEYAPIPQTPAPTREFALEPHPHLIEFFCDHDTKQVTGSVDGRKCVARWDGVSPVPELMTRRGFVPANKLRHGDVIQALVEEETAVPKIQEVPVPKVKKPTTRQLLRTLFFFIALVLAIVAAVVAWVLLRHGR